MYRLHEPVYYHPHRVMPPRCPWLVGHKIHRDVLPLPLSHLQWMDKPYWLPVLGLNLLTHEAPSNEVPDVSLHPAPVILVMKIMVHLPATWMHSKSGAVELLEDLLYQISRLGNYYPSPIPNTTICVDGLTLVTCT